MGQIFLFYLVNLNKRYYTLKLRFLLIFDDQLLNQNSMKTILIIGTSVVNFALISYSLFIFQEIKHRKVTSKLLAFLYVAVILDITATICMIIGSSKGIFTLHGLIGYSSLTAMIIDTILVWNLKRKSGLNSGFSKSLHLYSIFAYSWWILAYITGAILVFVFK